MAKKRDTDIPTPQTQTPRHIRLKTVTKNLQSVFDDYSAQMMQVLKPLSRGLVLRETGAITSIAAGMQSIGTPRCGLRGSAKVSRGVYGIAFISMQINRRDSVWTTTRI